MEMIMINGSCGKYKRIIWDFNGTLLDDVDIGISAVNRLLRNEGLPVLSGRDEYRARFCFPIKEYYRLLGFDISGDGYSHLAARWVGYYLEEAGCAPLRQGALYALSRFRDAGVPQYLISATERGMLDMQIEKLGIGGYFRMVTGLDNIEAHSKEETVRRCLAALPGASLMIGDTEHDSEAAAAAGAGCILVCGGHQSRERLEKTGRAVADGIAEAADMILDGGMTDSGSGI